MRSRSALPATRRSPSSERFCPDRRRRSPESARATGSSQSTTSPSRRASVSSTLSTCALGKRLDLVYERNGARNEIYVTTAPCPAQVGKNFGCIGFQPVPAYERVGIRHRGRQSGEEFVAIANQTFSGLALLVTQFAKYAPEIAGPIGMGQVAATVQDWGWGPYFSLAATISFALGLFNLLPIPALDGGRAAFIIAELIRGRPVDPEKEAMVHIAGFAALMALIMLVAFHDIARIVNGQGIM